LTSVVNARAIKMMSRISGVVHFWSANLATLSALLRALELSAGITECEAGSSKFPEALPPHLVGFPDDPRRELSSPHPILRTRKLLLARRSTCGLTYGAEADSYPDGDQGARSLS
jgi:hypothetical protein